MQKIQIMHCRDGPLDAARGRLAVHRKGGAILIDWALMRLDQKSLVCAGFFISSQKEDEEKSGQTNHGESRNRQSLALCLMFVWQHFLGGGAAALDLLTWIIHEAASLLHPVEHSHLRSVSVSGPRG
jgi:hypothetical protein